MTISELFNNIKIIDTNINLINSVSKIASDSRKVETNTLFVAIAGEIRDGNSYINEAIQNGAVAIVTDRTTECKKPYHTF